MTRPRVHTASCSLCLLLASALPGRGLAASAGFVLQRSAVAAAGGVVSSSGMLLGLTTAQTVTGRAASATTARESIGFWTGTPWSYAVGVGDPPAGPAPIHFALDPLAPNPALDNVLLRFSVPASGGGGARVNLSVYDVSGRLVRVLLAGPQEPGEHRITWNGTNASGARIGSGIYFVALSAPSAHIVRRLVLLR